jgi:uncharacterized protein
MREVDAAARKREGPQRSCLGCGRVRPKEELSRLAVGNQGGLVVDASGRRPGRGAYLCGAGCLAAAVRRKAFHRAFRGKLTSMDLTSLEVALSR